MGKRCSTAKQKVSSKFSLKSLFLIEIQEHKRIITNPEIIKSDNIRKL